MGEPVLAGKDKAQGLPTGFPDRNRDRNRDTVSGNA